MAASALALALGAAVLHAFWNLILARAPDIEAAVRYYTERAPSILPPSPSTVAVGPGKLRAERIPIKLEGAPPFAGTTQLAVPGFTVRGF